MTIYIDSNSVGIGTTVPQYNLDVRAIFDGGYDNTGGAAPDQTGTTHTLEIPDVEHQQNVEI